MQTKIKKEIEIIITLNEEEAKWLKNIVQDPCFGPCNPSSNLCENTIENDEEIRKRFLNSLKYIDNTSKIYSK